VDSYVEVREGARTIYRSIGGGKSGELEAMDVNVPYSVTRPFEKQRQVALAASDTLYAYDFLELLERAVQLKWEEYAKLRPRSDVLRPRNVSVCPLPPSLLLVFSQPYSFLGLLERAVQHKWEEHAKLHPRSDVPPSIPPSIPPSLLLPRIAFFSVSPFCHFATSTPFLQMSHLNPLLPPSLPPSPSR